MKSVRYVEPRFPNDNWTRVEIYRLIYGHLPSDDSDLITTKTLKAFVQGVRAGFIESDSIDVVLVANLIQRGEVKTSEQMKEYHNANG